MQIQLPISTEQLLDQVRVTREFTEKFNPHAKPRFSSFLWPWLSKDDVIAFYATFDRETELNRLNSLELALKSGVKSLQFT